MSFILVVGIMNIFSKPVAYFLIFLIVIFEVQKFLKFQQYRTEFLKNKSF